MEKKVSVSGFRYTGKRKNKQQEFDVSEEVSFQNITMYKYVHGLIYTIMLNIQIELTINDVHIRCAQRHVTNIQARLASVSYLFRRGREASLTYRPTDMYEAYNYVESCTGSILHMCTQVFISVGHVLSPSLPISIIYNTCMYMYAYGARRRGSSV